MQISVQQLKNDLKKAAIPYTLVFGENLREQYQLASLKHKVKGGVYYVEKEYSAQLNQLEQSVVITNASVEDLPTDTSNAYLLVKHPQVAFYKLCRFRRPPKKQGIHPTAVIDPEAILAKEVYIGPYAVIGKCRVETGCSIAAHVVIADEVVVKQNTRIEPNSYIGANGVAWVWAEDGQRIVQPQFGGVVIEANCFIGSDVSIVRGSVNEQTTIGKGTLIAHGSKIGHGGQLGAYCHLANNVSLAGNCRVGNRAFLGSGSVLSSQVTVGDDCVVGAGAVVVKSFPQKECILTGVPAKITGKTTDKKKHNGVPKKTKQ